MNLLKSDRQIVIAGAGGHAGMVVDTIRAMGGYHIAGLVECSPELKETAHDLPVLGTDAQLPALMAGGVLAAANGVGSIRDNSDRRRVFERLKKTGFVLPPLVHPHAWVSESATLGAGTQIMPGSLVLRSVVLGENVLVNSGAIVEHDCRIGDHVHVCTGVRIGGQVTIGSSAFIGLGTSIRQSISIGAGALIGAGSVVIDDVPAGVFVAGVPARRKSS